MIIDKIENYRLYTGLNKRISKAFDFIVKNDLTKMELGKHKIDGDKIFALLQEYDTKEVSEGKLERHFKYIDLQYVIQGAERMGVSTWTNQIPIDENQEADYAFYSGDSSLIKIDEGMFAIFFPHDLHMPCIKLNDISKVRKVVIKIMIDE